MAKTVLVTGGAGFIGSHLVDKLIDKGYNVIAVDNLSTGRSEYINNKALFYQIDITNIDAIKQVFQVHKPSTVFHLAAQISVSRSTREPAFDALTNVVGTVNLLEASIENGAKKFVFSSSGGVVYGEVDEYPIKETMPFAPVSPYGISKMTGEYYLRFFKREKGLDYVALRYANVYGPRQDPYGEAGVVAIFINKILKGEKPVINGDGEYIRDYVFVDDVVNANIKAMEYSGTVEVNISTSKGTSVNELFKILKSLTKFNNNAEYGPPRPGDIRKNILDNNLAREKLSWKPSYSLENGLKETIEYFKAKVKSNGPG
ncbi:MAG: SDR family NAD(P)-dependent oxidoreductase [Thermotogae bacterium]|nr:SDR family NAD(P)-dependent oxidoreductase [Thermotogota bacterium]